MDGENRLILDIFSGSESSLGAIPPIELFCDALFLGKSAQTESLTHEKETGRAKTRLKPKISLAPRQ